MKYLIKIAKTKTINYFIFIMSISSHIYLRKNISNYEEDS